MSDAKDVKDVIVIAEDSPPNRKILAHLLEKMGFEVLAFENGQVTWEALRQMPPEKHVIAVISDIMMPAMDGLELLKSIRQDKTLKALPVVLVTAVSDKDHIVQAKALHVNGYILKPVTFQRVADKLHELFPDKTFTKPAA
ncbi:MAG: response regulator [Bdellovibrionales bacterium]